MKKASFIKFDLKCCIALFASLCVVVVFIISLEAISIRRISSDSHLLKESVKKEFQALISDDNIKRLQPCQKNNLGRRVDIHDNVTLDEVTNATVLSLVQRGGTYKPKHCDPTDSVAIIIPYRDREKHLEIFINYMHAFLQRQQLQYGIFVAELARPTTFNKNILINVGFLTAQSTGLYNCYVIHDVDLLPLDDRNTYSCSNQLHHLAVANSKFKYILPYEDYVGGVVALKEDLFMNMNGISNLYFGWGGEDDDIQRRVSHGGYKIYRPNKTIGIYKALPHPRDNLNPINKDRFKLLDGAKYRWQQDGLNSLNYQRLSYKEYDLYTYVYVKVNQSDVLNTTVKLIINDVPIYESDLLTIRNKHIVNMKIVVSVSGVFKPRREIHKQFNMYGVKDLIVDAYLHLLQTRSKGEVFTVKYKYKFLKNPEFPKGCVSTGVRLVLIPVRLSGYWCLIVIYPRQKCIALLDPNGIITNTQKTNEIDFTRRIYQNQFGIDLQEQKTGDQITQFPENGYDSGLLIMICANALSAGNLCILQQVDIDGVRAEIESTLRQYGLHA